MARLRGAAAAAGLLLLFLAPQLALRARFASSITADPAQIADAPVVVFGAAVRADGSLSEVSAQRIAAAALLYRTGHAGPYLVSGTGTANAEVDRMADALIAAGVPAQQVQRDPWGVDSADTCRHVAALGWRRAALVTQRFHLPRVLQMCEDQDIEVQGFDAAAGGSSSSPGLWTLFTVRSGRLLRESGLTWLHVLGLYDRLSQEAERAGH